MSEMFGENIKNDADAQRVIRDWIDALRSGSYPQGEGQLRRGVDTVELPEGVSHDYCCLGVLCDRINPHGWDDDDGAGWLAVGSTELAHSVLPSVTCSSLYMDLAGEGRFVDDDDGSEHSLVIMNDSDHPFREIADRIEQELQEALA